MMTLTKISALGPEFYLLLLLHHPRAKTFLCSLLLASMTEEFVQVSQQEEISFFKKEL